MVWWGEVLGLDGWLSAAGQGPGAGPGAVSGMGCPHSHGVSIGSPQTHRVTTDT